MHATLPLLLLQLFNAPAPVDDPMSLRVTPEVRVVRKVAPSVVYITTEGPEQTYRTFFRTFTNRPQGSGSGVVIHEDGYIVTNYHVVRTAGEAGRISVTFDRTYDEEGRVYEAQLISAEPQEDLALIKIEGPEPFLPADLGTSSDLMIAERVLAIGNPYGQTHTVSTGIISGLHRDVKLQGDLHFDDLIQTDAAINPGNSGGALVNIHGQLIGINTAMNVQAENIGFAIPVDRVRRVLQDRLLSPSLARAWFGFDVDLETLRVRNVLEGSPADRAEVRVGDRITGIGASPIANAEDYRFARLELAPDQEAALTLERDGEERKVLLPAWDRVRGLLFARLGVEVEEVEIIRNGFRMRRPRLTSVRDGSPAQLLGLSAGDILEAVTPRGGRILQPQSGAELALLVNALEPGAVLELDLWRDLDEDGRLEREGSYSELFQGPLELD